MFRRSTYLKKNLFIAGLLAISSFGFAQSKEEWVNPDHTSQNTMGLKDGWYAGADFGTSLFYGDVALYNYWPKFKDYKKSFGSGYSVYGGKKLIKGMIAELQFYKGTLNGEKRADKLYPRYFIADVMDYSVNFKFNLSQQIFRQAQQHKFFNRLSVYATVGGGQTFFRSRLYKQALNQQWYLEKTNGYSTTGIDSAGITSAGGLVTKKKGMESAISIPVGGKLAFKLNATTDITFDLRYVTVLSDKLDSWERSWTHYDKYMYMGIGLTYNFVKAEDMPDSQRFHVMTKDEKEAGVAPADEAKVSKRGLFKKKSKSDKDAELRLKMYELMLLMFEMQYMN